MDEKREDYNKWYEQQFKNVMQIDKLRLYAEKHKNKQLIEQIDNFFYTGSNLWKYNTFIELTYLITLKKERYEYTVLKVQDKQNEPINYALLFGINKPEYLVNAGSLISADGEYRDTFVQLEQIKLWYKEYGDKLFNKYIKALNKKIKLGKLELIADGPFAKYIYDNNLHIIIYTIGLSIANHNTTRTIHDHHHPLYNYYMKSYDAPKIQAADFLMLTNIQDFSAYSNPTSTRAGIKNIPITLFSLQHLEDITLPIWKEIFIAKIINKIILNNINCGFSLYIGWFYVNLSPKMFDNDIILQKIEHSEKCKDIIKQIEAERKYLYTYDKENDEEIYLSYQMETFSNKIELSLDYAEQEIVLSDYVICNVSEYIGNTFAYYIDRCIGSPIHNIAVGFMYKNFESFEVCIFNYIYNLWCLNYRGGIIHGDLHLNNITLQPLSLIHPIYDFKEIISNIFSIYKIQDDYYYIKQLAAHSSIIDFSRSFIWSDELRNNYDEVKIKEIKIYNINRLIKLIEITFPDFFRDYIFDLVKVADNHFEVFYNICEAIDTYTLLNNMQIFFSEVLITDIYNEIIDRTMIESQLLPMFTKFKKQIYMYFTNNMLALIKNPLYTISLDNRINLILLRTFENRLLDNVRLLPEHRLVNYFCDTTEFIYNSENYDDYPPMCKLEKAVSLKFKDALLYYKNKLKQDIYDKEENTIIESSLDIEKNKNIRRGIHND